MKRLWNKIGSGVKNANHLKMSIEEVAKIEKGETKVGICSLQKQNNFFRSFRQNTLRRRFAKSHLVENMNKMNITSTDPVERWTSTKDLPTRESEFLHRNDPMWEYGFYEPPVERIPKDKLMFREALEYLRCRQELLSETSSEPQRKQAAQLMSDHVVTARVNSETLDDIYEYFRPFERKDKQKVTSSTKVLKKLFELQVVNRHALAELQDHLQGHSDERKILDEAQDVGKKLRQISDNAKFLDEYQRVSSYEKLEDQEKEKVREAIAQLRQEEHERLNKRLGQIGEMEKSAQEAMKKAVEEKKHK
ncbi:Protein CBG06063 [Caenorhabditis briggsae]|uniref:Protein CBG06063 n=1 Tax=Caenorhabditis briggsae TaxID=6238 RepID=A8X0Z7_CAEBR|nr:Protein CBG06063 [Caenorhabditis briggsae]CAP26307.2 Protein CBG06063 [Caenorhabditis briggsae]